MEYYFCSGSTRGVCSLNKLSICKCHGLAADHPGHIRPVEHAEHDDEHLRAVSGGQCREQRDHEDERGESHEKVHEPGDCLVNPATIEAGEHAEHNPDHGGE